MLIDFTLEEDDYHPVFYGLEAFRDSLAELLPEAEARTIHQLLDEEASKQLGNIYRDVGRRYILSFTIMAATVAAVPLPFADNASVNGVASVNGRFIGKFVWANNFSISSRWGC